MPDNRPRAGGLHGRYVNIGNSQDRKRWAATLNVSEEKLLAAVDAVGPAVEDVRSYLGLKGLIAAGRRPARRASPSR